MTPHKINRILDERDAARTANAILVSINADLAAACQATLAYLDGVDTDIWPPALDKAIRAALARQRTETPAPEKGPKL